MAKVKIQGHASGTGVLTVTAPNTSTDRTITLPDSTDTLAVNSDVTNKLPLAGGTLTGNLSLTTSGDSKIIVTSGNSSNGQIRFDDAAGTDRGRVHYEHSDDTMVFKVADTTKARLTADGLCFNSDNAAANALDDYEEGTFTATLTSVPTAPTNPPTATGSYTKVGNRVHFEIFRWSNVDTSGGSGEMRITGLPFTASTATITQNVATYGMNFDTSRFQWCEISTTIIYFVQSGNGTSWSNWDITAGTGKYLSISGSYQTS